MLFLFPSKIKGIEMSVRKIASIKLHPKTPNQKSTKNSSIIFSMKTEKEKEKPLKSTEKTLKKMRKTHEKIMISTSITNIKLPEKEAPSNNIKNSHHEFTLKEREVINQKLFSNANEYANVLADTHHHLFQDFRKYVLKEDPNTTAPMDSLIKFSNLIHKFEIELGKKYQMISTLNSIYPDGGVFNPKSPFASQVSAGEYIMTTSQMTLEEIELFDVFSKEFKENHLAHFEGGNVSNMTASTYMKYIKNSDSIGYPGKNGGRWVQPKDTIEKTFEFKKKFHHLSLSECLTKKMGMSPGYYDDNPVLAVIADTPINQLQITRRDLAGVNDQYFDGGHTEGTLEREASAPREKKAAVAIGIWGLPENHPLHPYNAKVGNFLEVEAFLDSRENMENLKKLMRTPLQDQIQGNEIKVDTQL
jgi:hypothetical protein